MTAVMPLAFALHRYCAKRCTYILSCKIFCEVDSFSYLHFADVGAQTSFRNLAEFS